DEIESCSRIVQRHRLTLAAQTLQGNVVGNAQKIGLRPMDRSDRRNVLQKQPSILQGVAGQLGRPSKTLCQTDLEVIVIEKKELAQQVEAGVGHDIPPPVLASPTTGILAENR